mgnify:CR=1 FL=1
MCKRLIIVILSFVTAQCLGIVLATTTILAQSPKLDTPASSDEPTSITAEMILDRAIERIETQDESGLELNFESIVLYTVEKLNGDGEITDTETTKYRRYPLEGLLYEELIERNGLPLNEDDVRKAEKDKREFIKEVQKHAERGEDYEPDEYSSVQFNREMMSRYNIELVDTDTLREDLCWVLQFVPREGKLPDNKRMDKALNRSTGKIWVTQNDYGVARVSFKMQKPFRYLWGIVATLRRAEGQLDFIRVSPKTWYPSNVDINLDLNVFFRGIRRHIRQDLIEHHPLNTISALH